MNKLSRFLLKRVRWVIVGVGLLAGVVLFFAGQGIASTAWGSLLINLSASALTVAFTALLIDWLYERRQRLLMAQPLEFARHELSSVIFTIGLTLGRPYLGQDFSRIVQDWFKTKDVSMDGLAVMRKSLISTLERLTPANCPETSTKLATILNRQLGDQVSSIDEILRLYGFALDAELRDSVHLLRDRIVSLRNSLSTFGIGGGVQDRPAMQQLVAISIQSLAEAAKSTDTEWGQVGKAK